MVPLTLPVGSINRVDSLVVTDSFGVQTLIQPIGTTAAPSAGFSMWQHEVLRRAGNGIGSNIVPNLFFLPPALGQVIESRELEDVLFMRDEVANVAWAVERAIEDPVEQAFTYAAPPPPPAEVTTAPAATVGTPLRYVLASTVPENWNPLIPVQLTGDGGGAISRLKRGAMLDIDGTPRRHTSRSRALSTGTELILHDEDVPREGVHLTQVRRMSRWIDGSTWVWTAFRKKVGLGEGSSGLVFDQLKPDPEGCSP